jgi:hypothetical protein
MEPRGRSVRAGFTLAGELARKAQPWPFFLVVFFLATFLAAFFFFLAMEMAPCHEHPVMHLTSTPPDAHGKGVDDVSTSGDEQLLPRITRRCQELWLIPGRIVKRRNQDFRRPVADDSDDRTRDRHDRGGRGA